jgi:hypothetical protein
MTIWRLYASFLIVLLAGCERSVATAPNVPQLGRQSWSDELPLGAHVMVETKSGGVWAQYHGQDVDTIFVIRDDDGERLDIRKDEIEGITTHARRGRHHPSSTIPNDAGAASGAAAWCERCWEQQREPWC